MCVCVCVCVCIYVYIYIYIHICIHISVGLLPQGAGRRQQGLCYRRRLRCSYTHNSKTRRVNPG